MLSFVITKFQGLEKVVMEKKTSYFSQDKLIGKLLPLDIAESCTWFYVRAWSTCNGGVYFTRTLNM